MKTKITSPLSLKKVLLSSFFILSGSSALANPEFLAKIRDLRKNGKEAEAIPLLQKEIQKKNVQDERKLMPFALAMLHYQSGAYDKAIAGFEAVLREKHNLEEYAYFYKGMSHFKMKNYQDAQNEFKKVDDLAPNAKLRIDSVSMLGQIALQRKDFKQAKAQFKKIEKRTRGSEEYPEVVYFMALTEQGLDNHRALCGWAEKLYSRYPSSTLVKDWGYDLATNKLGDKATGCASALDDFKTRIRHLIFAGYDKKAQGEINDLRQQLGKVDPYLADQVQAQYYAQQGELTKAYELLKPYYEAKKNNFSFLITFASVAARAGEVQAAVGSYYSAYKISPRARLAKQALYQAAFLSYQFQDYDGAGRRFKEFMKVYPKSPLTRDAKWQLAWIKYLKGDYQGAYASFRQLNQERTRRASRSRDRYPTDRMTYWMAMSLYRQEKYEQSKTLFEDLAKDPLLGYYSIAAQYRLKKIQTLQPRLASRAPMERGLSWATRMPSSEFMIPTIDDRLMPPEPELERETEEGLVMQELAEDTEESESNELAEGRDAKRVEVEITETDKDAGASHVLAKRFEKARDLMAVGLEEWAKWDLYDIEKKTRNREFLKSLMAEYSSVGYFNRSSYIGQVYFSNQRASGLEVSRSFWEYAYPRAFDDDVEKFSKEYAVPNELIWGIMRAESQYRKDAISPVGALGLMQVMPFTGYRVAQLLGQANFQPRQLLEPTAAIKMGSRYLQRLMVKFENTIPLAAAGYNAGPHRVKNWLASFGHLETDEFIEHIPFLETRNYVKKVVSNCHVYSQLYGDNKDLFAYLVDPVPHKSDGQMVHKESWDDI